MADSIKTKDVYSQRLELLESHGFKQYNGCISNGQYAFLYHQIDTSEMTDKEFQDFIDILKTTES